MNVTALDLSLTATGYAFTEGFTDGADAVAGTARPRATMREGERLAWIINHLTGWAGLHIADMVIIEDIPMHAKSAGLTAQLHGAVKLTLHEHGRCPPTLITPATLKTFATGKGNSDKTAMVVAARDRLGYTGLDNNEADALWLLQLALVHFDLPGAVRLPQTHLRALDKVEWT